MTSILEMFTAHHGRCDDAFAAAEGEAQQGHMDGAHKGFAEFCRLLEVHLKAEEDILFPAFENATGMRGGPPAVMRMEHQQMRALVTQAGAALAAQDADEFAGVCETLNILIQQHNRKEEHMLYPMCDRQLGSDPTLAASLVRALQG